MTDHRIDDPDGVTAALRRAGCVFAEEETALLLAAARDDADLTALVARRVGGEPLEQVLGWAELAGVRVRVAPGVFVPRRRSALLVAEAVAAARAVRRRGRGAVLLDLCCGTGAVAAAVLAAAGEAVAEVHAADVDPAAVACARANLPTARVHEGDLWAALPASLTGRLDVIVANAPYVPTDEIAAMPPEARLHEAHVALDGGADGLDLHRRILAAAGDWLAPLGVLVLETSRRQADRSRALAAATGLVAHLVTDDDVDGTAVVAHRTA